jgi:hypothetical protein
VEAPVLENSGRTSRGATALFPGSAIESFPWSLTGSCGRGCVGQMSQVVRTHSVPDWNTNVQINISRPNELVSIPHRHLVRYEILFSSDEKEAIKR